jgi:hypothetical protein
MLRPQIFNDCLICQINVFLQQRRAPLQAMMKNPRQHQSTNIVVMSWCV